MPLAALWHPKSGTALVPRGALTFVRLTMPVLGRGQWLDAARLQLTQYMPPGPFGFVCRRQSGGALLAWAWAFDATALSPRRSRCWAEPALDEPAQGLRLVRRSSGFEAQQWSGGELRHSRWFESLPGADDWQRFARGCGFDPQDHPLPDPTVARTLQHPSRGWLAGDNLPAPDPWQGWHWQAAVLLLGAVAAAAAGVHAQARQQLRIDTERLATLRSGREAALLERARYELASNQLESLRMLVPPLTQLELLDRVSASGIFAPPQPHDAATPPKTPPAVPATAAAGLPTARPAGSDVPGPAATRLLDWDYRNGLLKMTLELPEREVTLLEITRRLERVAGLGALRVGQDSAGNTLTLSASIAELAPPARGDAPRAARGNR